MPFDKQHATRTPLASRTPLAIRIMSLLPLTKGGLLPEPGPFGMGQKSLSQVRYERVGFIIIGDYQTEAALVIVQYSSKIAVTAL